MLPDLSANDMLFIRKKKKGPGDWERMDYILDYLFTQPKKTGTKPNNRCLLLSVKLAKLIKKEQQLCCLMALCEYMIKDAFTDKKFVTKEYKKIIEQFQNDHLDYETTQKAIVQRFHGMRNHLLEKWVKLIRILERIEKEEMTEEWEYIISYPIQNTKKHLENLINTFPVLLMATPLYLIQKEILTLDFDNSILNATSHRDWENLNDNEKTCLTKTIQSLYKKANYNNNTDSLKNESEKQYKIIFNMEKRRQEELQKERDNFLKIVKKEDEYNRQCTVKTVKKVKTLLDKEELNAKQNLQISDDVKEHITKNNIKYIYILLLAQFNTDTLVINSLAKYYPRSKKEALRKYFPINTKQAKIFYSKDQVRQQIQEIRSYQCKYKYKMFRIITIDTTLLLAAIKKKHDEHKRMLAAITNAKQVPVYIPSPTRYDAKGYTLTQNEHSVNNIAQSDIALSDLLSPCSFKPYITDVRPAYTTKPVLQDRSLNEYQLRNYLREDQYLCQLQKGMWHIVTYKHTVTNEIVLIQFVSADTLTEKKWNSHPYYEPMLKIGTIDIATTDENFVYHYHKANEKIDTWGLYVWSNNIDTKNPKINAIELRLATNPKTKITIKDKVAPAEYKLTKAKLLTYYDDDTIREYQCLVDEKKQKFHKISSKKQQHIYDSYEKSHDIKKEIIILDGTTCYAVVERPETHEKYYFPI